MNRGAWIGALWIVSGCSLSDHPSLGWDERFRAGDSGRSGSEPPQAGTIEPPALPDAGGTMTASVDAAPPAMPDGAVDMPGDTIPDSGPAPDAGPDTTKCPTGTYLLQMMCLSPAGNTVMTTSMLQVQPPMNGAALATGMLNFTLIGATSTADIMGTLDCSAGTLHAGIVNGVFQFVGTPPATFSGTLDGALDPSTRGLSGTWSCGTPDLSCDGTWTGMLQP